jgi:hypothetical protein
MPLIGNKRVLGRHLFQDLFDGRIVVEAGAPPGAARAGPCAPLLFFRFRIVGITGFAYFFQRERKLGIHGSGASHVSLDNNDGIILVGKIWHPVSSYEHTPHSFAGHCADGLICDLPERDDDERDIALVP